MLRTRQDLVRLLGEGGGKRRLGVAAAHDAHTLQAVARAAGDGLIEPVLIGRAEEIRALWAREAGALPLPAVIPVEEDAACAQAAVSMARGGEVDCIMKGRLETATLMREVVARDTGIRTGSVLSIVAMMESPYYYKLFAVTDVGLLTYPTLEQKKGIIQNAVGLFRALGAEEPKVAVLAAVERENPKIPESVDAARLKQMQLDGLLGHCIVEGPISYDLCMDREAAAIKGYQSPVAGDPDILVVPDIASGNLLSKALTCTGGAHTCGTVCGAAVPIVITSRSAPAEDKYMSIILAAAANPTQRR